MKQTGAGFRVALLFLLSGIAVAQGRQPYPNAITDHAIHPEKPMPVPVRNHVFPDPDFGSLIVRASDETTNAFPNGYLRNSGSGEANAWNANGTMFYAIGQGGRPYVFGFRPATMRIVSPTNPNSDTPLALPLRPGPTFSATDPDLIYGTTSLRPLAINSFRISTGMMNTVVDAATCGTHPAINPSSVSDDSVSVSADDRRLANSMGGRKSGDHPFLIVYDKVLGCRWYNTLTGEIGGEWGVVGGASTSDRFLIRHPYISKSGKYVVILTNTSGFYVWDIRTTHVQDCTAINSAMRCHGYGVVGFNSYVNAAGFIDQMNIVERSLTNIGTVTPLVWPLDPPYYFGQIKHFTWANTNSTDTAPVCGSTYSYDGDPEIDSPYNGEIFCVETDGRASTIWRFAHHRALWVDPYFQTQPLGDVSRDGRFFLFTSTWNGELGRQSNGIPRSDVFVVKLK
jgi:hypothetical protein